MENLNIKKKQRQKNRDTSSQNTNTWVNTNKATRGGNNTNLVWVPKLWTLEINTCLLGSGKKVGIGKVSPMKTTFLPMLKFSWHSSRKSRMPVSISVQNSPLPACADELRPCKRDKNLPNQYGIKIHPNMTYEKQIT